jgi:hypothetical protein
LNASGSQFDSDGTDRFFVKPIRNNGTTLPTGFRQLAYNPTTGEIIWFGAAV